MTQNYDSNPEIAAYFQGLREGRLLIRVCKACGKPNYFPRALCPYCFGDTDWKQCSGEGTLYSYSIMRKADDPYVVAYVTLAEGVTMLTHVVGADPGSLKIGMPLAARFSGEGVPADGVAFAPR